MIGLSRKYMSVERDGNCSFGGNQGWFRGMIGVCGCGVVGAADILWYLRGEHGMPNREQYDKYVRKIRKSFLMIPFRGMPGFWLAICLNVHMIRNGLKYRVSWGTRPSNIGNSIGEMLKKDIPVLFCVGPCFHRLLSRPQERGLKLYCLHEGRYVWTKTVRNHFMVITEIDGEWAKVSSWGEEYYIRISELEDCSLRDGLGAFTNIIRIRKRN